MTFKESLEEEVNEIAAHLFSLGQDTEINGIMNGIAYEDYKNRIIALIQSELDRAVKQAVDKALLTKNNRTELSDLNERLDKLAQLEQPIKQERK